MKKEKIELLKKSSKEEQETEIVKIGTQINKLYLTLILNILAFGVLNFVVFTIIKKIWVLILVWVFGFPLFILSIIFSIIMLIRDRNLIKSWLVKKISRNFIIVRFWYDNKKTKNVAFRVSGNEIRYENKLYIIHEADIWHNEHNQPVINFFYGFPNSLHLDFQSQINKYNKLKAKAEKENKSGYLEIFDEKGTKIDVAYSSETLEKFKRDKFLEELHRPINDTMKTFMMILLVIVLILLVILIIINLQRGNTQPVTEVLPK